MEHSLAGAEDALIESLSFNLPNSAKFIVDRRSVSFFSQMAMNSAHKDYVSFVLCSLGQTGVTQAH